MGITAFGINMLNFAILNLLIWFVGVGVTVYFLYYEDADRPIRRITECEVLVLCMSVCETLGVLLLHCFLQICGISNIDVVMQYCLEVTFSKLIMIFLYYVLINRSSLFQRTIYHIWNPVFLQSGQYACDCAEFQGWAEKLSVSGKYGLHRFG